MRGLLGLYSVAFIVSCTTLILSLFALVRTDWITAATPSTVPVPLRTSYGLFEACETAYGLTKCRPFPQRHLDCGRKRSAWPSLVEELDVVSGNRKHGEEEKFGFCDAWITAGYATQLSLVFALANLLALVLTLIGTAAVGRGFRTEKLRSGWKLVAGLMTLQAVCLAVTSSLVAYERDHDSRFALGVVHLARSWTMSTVAYALNFAVVASILFIRATGRLRIVPGDEGYMPVGDGA
ncbi:hypothetical protein JCM11251_002945 [Rhodosporidiobolus azoricus]